MQFNHHNRTKENDYSSSSIVIWIRPSKESFSSSQNGNHFSRKSYPIIRTFGLELRFHRCANETQSKKGPCHVHPVITRISSPSPSFQGLNIHFAVLGDVSFAFMPVLMLFQQSVWGVMMLHRSSMQELSMDTRTSLQLLGDMWINGGGDTEENV